MAARRKEDPAMQWQFEGEYSEEQLEAMATLIARWFINEIRHKNMENNNEDET